MNRHRLTLFTLLAVLLLAPGADAAESAWVREEHAGVRLIAASETTGRPETGTGNTQVLLLGLQFDLAKDWKIYWRSPGDAGLPPEIDWSKSENVASVATEWPVPERFSALGFETLGYHDEVVLPLAVKPAEAGKPVAVRTVVNYLVCNDICIPLKADLSVVLPAEPLRPSGHAHLINRYRTKVPGDGAAHGLQIEQAEILQNGNLLRVSARASMPFDKPDVFAEGPPELSFSKPRVRLGDGGTIAVLDVTLHGAGNVKDGLSGAPLTLTLVDGARSAQTTVQPTVSSSGGGTDSILAIFAIALLGGLILNLMPCVLPVLSIKVLSVIGHGGAERRHVRSSFLASAAGIVVSFLVLAAALLALRSAGTAIGWGIQFQQPWFLAVMAAVVVAFACNLWGFFEIRLPSVVADAGARIGHGLGGHFLTGMLATLLATPCSAPFVGTAVGFALAGSVLDLVTVFGALGLGLAIPYLAIAAVPGLATRLPKPGSWMIKLRVVLGIALAATALWLLAILGRQAGVLPAFTAGLLLTAGAMALYLRSRMPDRIGRVGLSIAAALGFIAAVVPVGLPAPSASSAAPLSAKTPLTGLWKPFDDAAIARHVAEGRTVFVDVTADWCITCQVNKAFVLGQDEIYRRLADPAVLAMQADWTLPSAAISAYLARFGRYGIPFNAVYGPGAPNGLPLPELLTRDAVLGALEQAQGKIAVSKR